MTSPVTQTEAEEFASVLNAHGLAFLLDGDYPTARWFFAAADFHAPPSVPVIALRFMALQGAAAAVSGQGRAA